MTVSGHCCEDDRYCLQDMELYETRTKYYLIGTDESRSHWKVLKIDRSEPFHLHLYEDPAVYTLQGITDLLSRLKGGNNKCGGVNLVTKAYGVVGFIKFMKPYYMILITKREKLGAICGHSIYGICESKLFRIPLQADIFSSMSRKIEEKYRKLFCSINLSKDFFYSYTYRPMWCLQKNFIEGDRERMPFDDMFVWNSFLTREFRNQIHSPYWTVPLVHGFFKQATMLCEEFNGTLTLIARRSRHFAGTRYFKRGVNAKGRVANDVETEQLVYVEDTDQITSVVQHRGSIPLFWSQETSVWKPKPDILLQRNGDPTYEATTLHFQNLAARYGNPIVVLNLAKTKENGRREGTLCMEFANAVAVINHGLPKSRRIRFIQCDMHMFMKRNNKDLQDVLESIASEVIGSVGFYYNEKASQIANLDDFSAYNLKVQETYDEQQQSVKRSFQRGILRSNCIDCLDRTNVSQYAFGLVALGQQLKRLGVSSTGHISHGSCIFKSLMDMYNQMGDAIALQYAGSLAHNKVFLQWQGKSNAAIQSQEFLRAFRRYYSNAILDGDRQDAINIFLGHYLPADDKVSLWEMDSANHLHIRRGGDDSTTDLRLSFKRSHSTGDLAKQSESGYSDSKLESEANFIAAEEFSEAKPLFSKERRRGSTLTHAELEKILASDLIISEAISRSTNQNSSQASIEGSETDSMSPCRSSLTTSETQQLDHFKNCSLEVQNMDTSNPTSQAMHASAVYTFSQRFQTWIEEGDMFFF